MTSADSDDPWPLTPGQRRLAGAALGLSAVLVLGFALWFVLEDGGGALVLLLLFAVVTLPVVGAALLAAEPAVGLLRGRPSPPRTPVCAGLLAVGHVGVALIALRPGVDRAVSTGDLTAGGVGAAGLAAALVALALTLPGRPSPVRVLLALSVGVLVLSLVALRAVAQTA
jgi:hypothetical protein